MTGSVFRTGHSQDYGGAVYLIDLTVSDAVFDGNTAVNKGGAIYISSSAAATITNCAFTNNQAVSGSVIYQLTSLTAVTTIKNATFRLNLGIRVIYSLEGNLLIATSLFDNNVSVSSPGLYVLLSLLITANCTEGCFVFAIAGSAFIQGVNSASGSVAFIQGSAVTMKSTYFANNAAGYAGTVHTLDQSTVRLAQVTFVHCVTTLGINSGASVLHIEQSELSITGPSKMQDFNNIGIFVSGGSVEIEPVMEGEGALVDGGGLNCVECSSLFIANSAFMRIQSIFGGCISLDGSLGLDGERRHNSSGNTTFLEFESE